MMSVRLIDASKAATVLGLAALLGWGQLHVFTQDPRGAESVAKSVKKRESDAFRMRLSNGGQRPFLFPGLHAANISWIWLELLQGLHIESSYEGDYSWMFSKLYTVLQFARPRERAFLTSLAPFYLVMGQDHAGATVLMEDLVKKSSKDWRPAFWTGFHAMENLFIPQMAAHFYGVAATFDQAPPYTAALSLRLKLGFTGKLDKDQRQQVIQTTTDPQLLDKIKKAHPDWDL